MNKASNREFGPPERAPRSSVGTQTCIVMYQRVPSVSCSRKREKKTRGRGSSLCQCANNMHPSCAYIHIQSTVLLHTVVSRQKYLAQKRQETNRIIRPTICLSGVGRPVASREPCTLSCLVCYHLPISGITTHSNSTQRQQERLGLRERGFVRRRHESGYSEQVQRHPPARCDTQRYLALSLSF